MKYKSIRDWARAKIDSQIQSVGFSNYSQEYLEDNYVQVALKNFSVLSHACMSSHIMSVVQCLNEKGYKLGHEKVLNSGASGEYFLSKIEPKLISNLYALLSEQEKYLSNLKYYIDELEQLSKLPKN